MAPAMQCRADALSIGWFYPDMPYSPGHDVVIEYDDYDEYAYYRSTTAFTELLRDMATNDRQAWILRVRLSKYLLGEAAAWWSELDEITKARLMAHSNGLEEWCKALER